MAKTYGDRWRTIRTIGQGGQSEVFEASDLTRPDGNTFALKRIRNPARRNRFQAEVRAIKGLDHPNIVKLVDHSALEDEAGLADKQFLVMPLAAGGSLVDRAKHYRRSLDGVLAIARPLASALAAAHAKGVIHRDVKPANVLFADDGNEPWLSDFGICLIRESDRHTETGEVAGPWAFMAPELEGGGRLEVTPAADVYSLGKLIYYALSGGIVMPRERLSEPEFATIFRQGERYGSLEFLLRRMVCALDGRIAGMAEVEAELARIDEWDRHAILPPFSPSKLDRIQALQRSVLDERQAVARHAAARQTQEQRTTAVAAQACRSAEIELAKAAALLSDGGVIRASSRAIPEGDLGPTEVHGLVALAGAELVVAGLSERYPADHVLQVLACRRTKMTVTMHVGSTPLPPPGVKDVALGILPRIRRLANGTGSQRSQQSHYLTTKGRLYVFPPRLASQAQPAWPPLIQQPHPLQLRYLEFPTGDWPGVEPHLREFLRTICDDFLAVLERSKDTIDLA